MWGETRGSRWHNPLSTNRKAGFHVSFRLNPWVEKYCGTLPDKETQSLCPGKAENSALVKRPKCWWQVAAPSPGIAWQPSGFWHTCPWWWSTADPRDSRGLDSHWEAGMLLPSPLGFLGEAFAEMTETDCLVLNLLVILSGTRFALKTTHTTHGTLGYLHNLL